jgi:arylsulfatase A-like enzyme
LITEEALAFVRQNKDRPFFLYFPTTIPHLALQVPESSLKEYLGAFEEKPYIGDRGYLPHRTPRAAYAAMITRMDREVGRLVALVRTLGLDDKTIFVFTSDNGPLYDRLGGTDADFFKSAGDFRGRKGSLYEGGIRVPCVVRWTGRVAAGSESARMTGFEDWLPTLLELVGTKANTPAGLDGTSFAPTLLGRAQAPRPFLYRETPGYGGQQCVRDGEWKGVRQRLNPGAKQPLAPGPIELYDLARDPGESRDVAKDHPAVVARLAALLTGQHTKSALFPIRALD